MYLVINSLLLYRYNNVLYYALVTKINNQVTKLFYYLMLLDWYFLTFVTTRKAKQVHYFFVHSFIKCNVKH